MTEVLVNLSEDASGLAEHVDAGRLRAAETDENAGDAAAAASAESEKPPRSAPPQNSTAPFGALEERVVDKISGFLGLDDAAARGGVVEAEETRNFVDNALLERAERRRAVLRRRAPRRLLAFGARRRRRVARIFVRLRRAEPSRVDVLREPARVLAQIHEDFRH